MALSAVVTHTGNAPSRAHARLPRENLCAFGSVWRAKAQLNILYFCSRNSPQKAVHTHVHAETRVGPDALRNAPEKPSHAFVRRRRSGRRLRNSPENGSHAYMRN